MIETLEPGPLESLRLILVPISLKYADIIFQEFTPEITRFMHPKPPEAIGETMRFIRDAIQRMKAGTELTLVILKKENWEFLGVCGIHQIHTETPELGIWTKKTAHGCGYGREAIHCLKTWADENLEYDYLSYPVDKHNIPSRKIPESLGGKVAREYEQMNLSNQVLRVAEYRIFR
ncbi:GNAT family N-acetyltransferase [Kovacikia minuta CCNUW1]|uniref:GNAT family N-acetyltransferase n=1 Tax=Kovacikia minuta TaxID=2931930 RepID=UPI001CCD9185|nr:GNAT family N-acetyltransferase [Kovacikia minuta]UBF27832.1 GNAT family N-acetyltransferase [Kovacikia minuta CCNUW1]